MFKKKWETEHLDFRNVQYYFNHYLEMLFCVCKGDTYCRNMATEDVQKKTGGVLWSSFN